MQVRSTQQWEDILNAYSSFEGSTVAFCKTHGIAQQTMYNQLRKHKAHTLKARHMRTTKVQCPTEFV
jgi:transcriptional regulator of acetoin/glycerol metabolism